MPTDTTNLEPTFHAPGTNRLLADLAAVRPEAVIVQDDGEEEPTHTPDLDGLRLVVEAVRQAPEEQFDMNQWGFSSCKTACCAIGWFCRVNPADSLADCDGKPAFLKDAFSFNEFFDIGSRFRISKREAIYLFDIDSFRDGSDTTRAEVIARLEQFIRDHTPATVPSDEEQERAEYDRNIDNDHDGHG